ncbi:MAG: DNA polymerase III subunit delta [Marinilabiliales bacterium]
MPSFNDIIENIKNRKYSPVYFLHGQEPYFIDKISDFIASNVLSEGERSFNQQVFYGKDSDLQTIIETCKRFPMMSEYQVIIVKEAQELKNFEQIHTYISKPLKSTILVLNYKYAKLDKRRKDVKLLMAALKKNTVEFESKKIYESNLPAWIENYVKQKDYKIGAKACSMLTEFLGDDLSRICNEIDKLLLVVDKTNKEITPEDIELNIGISKDYNVFELIRALQNKDIYKSNLIIDRFIKNPKNNPALVVIYQLYTFFTKLLIFHQMEKKSNDKEVMKELGLSYFNHVKEYRIAARNYSIQKCIYIIEYLRDYNMKIVGVGNVSTQPEELLRELIFKILH